MRLKESAYWRSLPWGIDRQKKKNFFEPPLRELTSRIMEFLKSTIRQKWKTYDILLILTIMSQDTTLAEKIIFGSEFEKRLYPAVKRFFFQVMREYMQLNLEEKFYTLQDVIHLTKIPKKDLIRMIRRGQIKAYWEFKDYLLEVKHVRRLYRRIFIPAEEVRRLLYYKATGKYKKGQGLISEGDTPDSGGSLVFDTGRPKETEDSSVD